MIMNATAPTKNGIPVLKARSTKSIGHILLSCLSCGVATQVVTSETITPAQRANVELISRPPANQNVTIGNENMTIGKAVDHFR
jgi:hypothetical protein